jgi:NADH-quinone oxidoreductase subunit J
MNTAAFVLIALLTLVSALAAGSLPRLIHAALCLVVAFIGVAAFYFLLGAEFVGLVQIFVYVGAVAVLIVFTILLTRRDEPDAGHIQWGGAIVALGVFAALAWATVSTGAVADLAEPAAVSISVRKIGEVLMTDYVWPLQCAGLVLTAALVGALVLVMEEER